MTPIDHHHEPRPEDVLVSAIATPDYFKISVWMGALMLSSAFWTLLFRLAY